MATDLAKLVVKLEAQTAAWTSGLDRATNRLNAFERQTKAVIGKVAGAFAGLATIGFAKSVIDAADHMNDLSKQTGVSVEGLSRLQYAAEQSGTDIEGLTTGLRKLSKTAADAAGGSKEAGEAFKRIGVSVKDASGNLKGSDELLVDVAEAFSGFEDGAGKSAAAMEIFGKSGAELIPFLNEGRAGIDKLRAEADRLGITMSTKSAQAADAFNDALNRAKGTAIGIVRDALTPLLQAFLDTSDGADHASAAMTGLQAIGKVIVVTFKGLASALAVTNQYLQSAGGAIGAVWAAEVQAMKGNFGKALEVMRLRSKDYEEEQAQLQDRLAAIWGDGADAIEAAGKKRRPLVFGDPEALAEVVVKAAKIQTDAMEKYYESLDEMSQTSSERETEQFDKLEAALNELRAAGRITAEEFQKRYSEALDATLQTVTVTAKKITPEVMKEFDKLNEFEIEAARNTQDIIADTLTHGFEGGISGIIKRFGEMLVQLTAQAVAADIGGKLFGKAAGGSAGGSGWLGKLAGLAAGFFGGGGGDGLSEVVVNAKKIGTMDSGGRGRSGEPYYIGTGAQPELFVPDRPGTFVPAGAHAGGGGPISMTFNLPPDQGYTRQTALQVGNDAARGAARGQRRNG